MLKILFAVWVGILPLIFWNWRFEGPKILWFLTGGAGIILFWLFRIIWQKRVMNISKTDLFYFLWLVILLISSIFGVDPKLSIIGGSYRHQGVLFFFLLWLIGKTFEIFPAGSKKIIIKFIAFGVIAESLLTIYQFSFGKLYFGKPLGTIGEANALAGFLVIGSYFIYRSFPKIFILFPVVSLLLSQSRSGMLAGMMICGNLLHTLKPKLKIAFWSIVILGMSIGMMILTSRKMNSPFENRFLVWKLGITKIAERPFLGFGAESGEIVYNVAFRNYGLPLENLMVDRSHNLYIDVAMWSGSVGLVAFAFWLVQRYKNLGGFPQKYAFVAFLIYSLFQPLSVVHWILLFLII